MTAVTVMCARTWTLTVVGIWWASYVLFPSWLLPISDWARLGVLAGLVLYLAVNSWLFVRWVVPLAVEVPGGERTAPEKRTVLVLIGLSGLSAALHLYPMSFPLMAGGDEGVHAYYALFFFDVLRQHPLLAAAPLAAAGVAVGAVAAWRRVVASARGGPSAAWRAGATVCVVSLVVLLGVYFELLSGSQLQLGLLRRYPPVSKFIYLATYAVFGVSDFWVRVPQLLLSIAAAVFVFRLCSLYRDQHTSLLAAGLFLLLPVTFFYAGLAYLTSGLVCLVAAAAFYFFRHVKHGGRRDLAVAAALVGTGFLYGRELVVMPLVFAGFLVAGGRRRVAEDGAGFYARMGWIAVCPMLPWLVMDRLYLKEYHVRLANWTEWDVALRHVAVMPRAMGYVGAVLFAAAVAHAVVKRRDGLTWFGLLWFGVWYAVMTSFDVTVIEQYRRDLPRLMLPAYPVAAILIAQMVVDGAKRLAPRRGAPLAATALLGYMLLGATVVHWPPLDAMFVAYRGTPVPSLPYEAAVSYLKGELPANRRILAVGEPTLWFYLIKCRVEEQWVHELWAEPERQTLAGLHRFAKARGVEYLLLPTGPVHRANVNEEVVQALLDGGDQAFRTLRIFGSGEHALVLAQVL